MTTRNNKIVHIIGEINRLILFLKDNSNKKFGLDVLIETLNINENRMRSILRFLLLNKIISMDHTRKSTKKYYYKEKNIKLIINNKVLEERVSCLGMTLLILNELQDCSITEINECIVASKESIISDIEKLQKQITK